MLRLVMLLNLNLALSACVVLPENTPASGGVGQVSVPVIIVPQAGKSQETAAYVCSLSAFTETYKAEDTNRGKARLSVKKQCLAQFSEMFCQDRNIKCTEY